MRSSTRVVSIALAATLLVAACGSDESGTGTGAGDGAPTSESELAADATLPDVSVETSPDTTSPDTTETSEPAESAQDVEADTAAAEAGLIIAADLPDGWTQTPLETTAASALDARLAECVGVDGDRISAADAAATSEQLVAPAGNLVVTEHIGVRAVERDARSVVALLTEPDLPACFEAAYGELAADAIGGTVAAGSEFGTPAVARLQVGSVGDATQAFRVVVPVTGDPSVVAVTIDHVLVRVGRSLATLTFENRTEATPVETIDQFTALAAERLPA